LFLLWEEIHHILCLNYYILLEMWSWIFFFFFKRMPSPIFATADDSAVEILYRRIQHILVSLRVKYFCLLVCSSCIFIFFCSFCFYIYALFYLCVCIYILYISTVGDFIWKKLYTQAWKKIKFKQGVSSMELWAYGMYNPMGDLQKLHLK
jgi:hypothetical protein